MNVTAYEKAADSKQHFYFVNFLDMKAVNYRFAGSHIHHSIEMVICYKGMMKATINNLDIRLKEGDILFINPLDWHFYEYVDNASCYILVMADEYVNDVLTTNDVEFLNKVSLSPDELNQIKKLLDDNYQDFEQKSFIAKKAFALSMFSLLENKKIIRAKEANSDKNICKKIICFIEEHYTEPLTIDRVAKEFGYSRNYFSALFNKLIGENFNKFVNGYRVSKAVQLKKENPGMLIDDIISSVGFNSRETYYRFLRNN